MAPKTAVASGSSSKRAPESKSTKAGLMFPVGRVESNLRKGYYAERIATSGPVFLAAVLEYLSAELLDLSGNVAADNKKHRINPRHIMMAIRNDSELDKLLGHVQISEAGVMQYHFETSYPNKMTGKKVPEPPREPDTIEESASESQEE